MKTYDVAKHPKTNQWHVIGNCGGGHWMPVSQGFKLRRDAELEIPRKLTIDAAARRELKAV